MISRRCGIAIHCNKKKIDYANSINIKTLFRVSVESGKAFVQERLKS